jgi:hypothetical protein
MASVEQGERDGPLRGLRNLPDAAVNALRPWGAEEGKAEGGRGERGDCGGGWTETSIS